MVPCNFINQSMTENSLACYNKEAPWDYRARGGGKKRKKTHPKNLPEMSVLILRVFFCAVPSVLVKI